jgi:hypothetical protein
MAGTTKETTPMTDTNPTPADGGFEAESAEPYQANTLRLYMSGASDAFDDSLPEYIHRAAVHTLDADAQSLAAYAEGRLGTKGSAIFHGVGRWHGSAEVLRVIEVTTYGMILKGDLEDVRAAAIRLGYTVFATVTPTTAAELY